MSVPVTAEVRRQISEMTSKGISHRKIAAKLGVGLATISRQRNQSSESNEVSGDTWSISIPGTTIHTLEQLVEHCKIDLSIWEVERFIVNKYEQAAIPRAVGKSKDWSRDSTEPIVTPLFQVKAFLRRKLHVVAVRNEIEELKKLAKKSAHVPKPLKRKAPSGLMLEVNVPDIHMGKLAWAVETGYQSYDTKIAAATYVRALASLVERTKQYKFEQVLFVVGNDVLNSDNIEGRTTSGTSVANDGRYQKTFWKTRSTMVSSIEMLRRIAPVKVVVVPGNHDTLAAWHLGDSLECYFHNYKDVEIENQPTPRKYHRFGKVLLMLTHGHKAKREDYPLLMATEQPEMFGATKFREAHTGHIHQTKTQEFHGVRVRVLPALCPADAWHSENGFVGNMRSAEAYVWSKEEGLIAQVFHNEDAQPALVTKRELVDNS